MPEIVPLNLSDLSPKEQAAYRSLIPKEYHPVLQGSPPKYLPLNTETLAFAEIEKGNPVGIIVSSAIPGIPESTIHCLYSDHPEPLLEKMEEALKNNYLQLWYWEDQKEASKIVEAATSRGWEGPAVYFTEYHFEVQKFHPSWFEKEYIFSKEYTLFPWSQLSTKEEKEVRHALDQKRFLPEMSPFDYPEKTDWKTSFGLRYRGEVIGWVVNHLINKDTIRYTLLFVEQGHRQKGEIIKLLIHSIKAQQNSSIPYSIFDVNHPQTSGQWLAFVLKRLAPYAQKVRREMMYWRSAASMLDKP